MIYGKLRPYDAFTAMVSLIQNKMQRAVLMGKVNGMGPRGRRIH